MAIWEHNRIVTALAATMWLINFATCIYCMFIPWRTWIYSSELRSGVATFRAAWVAIFQVCGVSDLPKTKFSLIFIIIAEIVFLALMLSGLMRWNNRAKGSLWHVLFTQVSPSWFYVLH